MKKPVTFTLEEELIDRLRRHSKETKVAQAQYVAMALEEYFKKNNVK